MFNFREALDAARKQVEMIIETDPELSRSEVGNVRLERENESAWTFYADIPKLIAQGWSPGAITVLVDKQDGHILTEEEAIRLQKNLDNTRRRAGFIRQK